MNNSEDYRERANRNIDQMSKRAEAAVQSGFGTAQDAMRKASCMAEDLVDSASAAMQGAQNIAGDALDKAKEEGQRRMKQVEGQVKDSPLAAIGIAFLSGVVLASLLRRS